MDFIYFSQGNEAIINPNLVTHNILSSATKLGKPRRVELTILVTFSTNYN